MRAWDPVVRLLHWGVAGIVVFDLVRDDGGSLHRWAGHAACVLVLVRLLWGCFAQGPARLRDLRPSVAGAWRYLHALLRGRAPASEGHNPLGTWMVWLLWTLVLLLGVSGWVMRQDAFWGEAAPMAMHAWLATALQVCVCLHVGAIAIMSFVQRENLPLRMITGRRRHRHSRAGGNPGH